MADPQESAASPARPTKLSPVVKVVVILSVVASFITGFMASEMREPLEPNEAAQGQLPREIQKIDPELFGPIETNAPPAPTPASGSIDWRGLHGLTSPFLAVLFGWLLFQHARGGLRMRANLWTGLPLITVFGGLIITGAFVLYPEFLQGWVDSQTEDNWLKSLHDLLGWLFFVGFLGHLVGAKLFQKKFK
jgi:hypothetical protein